MTVMGQKVKPIGLRLGINRGWDSTWFAKKKDFGKYLIEDFKIRKYIKNNITNSGVSEIIIERSSKKCTVSIHTSRPGFVIGKKGADIEKIKKNIMKITESDVNVNIKEIKKPELNSNLVAENIAQQLVKRVAYRRAMKRAMQSAMRLNAKGIKVMLSGRLAGNEETKKIVPLIKNVGTGTLKIISMGFLVDENKASLNWRGLILNRAVRHFLEDVEWGDMDYLVIDMPPGTGDVQMGLAKMLPRSDMIVVTTPSKTVQTVATRVASMAQSYYLRIAGVIENMSFFVNEEGKQYNIFGSGGGEKLAHDLGVPLLGSIPIDPFVSDGSDTGTPVILGEGHAADALKSIVDEIIAAVPKINPLDCTAHTSMETSVTISNS